MQLELIVRSKFQRFRNSADLDEMKDDAAFERFVVHSILSQHQPDVFASDGELLENICVGGPNDMGIDGLAIKLNDLLIRSKEDAEDLLERSKNAIIEFIFLQSKYKESFEAGEFKKFIAGVRDFLSQLPAQPANEKLKKWLLIKDYLISDPVVQIWEANPKVHLYFVSMGTWNRKKHAHIAADERTFKDDMLPSYKDCEVHYIDAEALRRICHDNDNTFKETIKIVQSMPLAEVDNVKDSCVALCSAKEYLRLLTTQDGLIRRSLFNSNVRDFQGATNVNGDIEASLLESPEKFCLLNNGITIVCDSFVANNYKVTLTNPQIVNGCQTSHVLFKAEKTGGLKLDKILLQIKIIATDHLDTTNDIVWANNNQNIVLAEAFETTRPFHIKLEEFFKAKNADGWDVYYERRAKQYQHDPRIKDKVNLSILTRFFVGMFLNQPHMSVRHESKLLKEFEGKIYEDGQSMLPYFITAAAFCKLEHFFRCGKLERDRLYSFRAHLLMLFRQLIAGKAPSINLESAIDAHSNKLAAVLEDETKALESFRQCAKSFISSRDHWIQSLKRSEYGMKDVPEFTDLLLSRTQVGTDTVSQTIEPDDKPRGRVCNVIVDRNGEYAGFIRRYSAENLFFHVRQNPTVDFRNLKGALVSYRVKKGFDGKECGIDVYRELQQVESGRQRQLSQYSGRLGS